MGGVFGERQRTRVAWRWPQARACPASHAGAGGRRSGLPNNALIQRVLGCRLGVGVEVTRPGIGYSSVDEQIDSAQLNNFNNLKPTKSGKGWLSQWQAPALRVLRRPGIISLAYAQMTASDPAPITCSKQHACKAMPDPTDSVACRAPIDWKQRFHIVRHSDQGKALWIRWT